MNSKEWEKIYAGRRDRLRQSLRDLGLDAILISQPANRFYLSGFELHDPQPNESAGRLVVTSTGEDWLATDSRYLLAARELWHKDRIFIYSGNAARDLRDLMARLASIAGYEREGISLDFAEKLASRQDAAFRPSFVAGDGIVEKLRLIKDESEIAALRKSFALNHKMLGWLEDELRSGSMRGLSEKELAWEIEKFFRENGADELAFSTIAALGPAGARPHAVPGATRLVQEMPLLVDVGCRVDNYCSDQTRTWWIGRRPTEEFERALELVKKAQKTALAAMRPGVACSEIYKKARDVFCAAGQEKFFTHGLGHGVGLETHEGPSLSPRCDLPLQAGMIITVEPGLYYPQWGGVRWEHTVLVEENGVAIL